MDRIGRLSTSAFIGAGLTLLAFHLGGSTPIANFFTWPFGAIALSIGSLIYGALVYLFLREGPWTWRTWARFVASLLVSCVYMGIGLFYVALEHLPKTGKLVPALELTLKSANWPMILVYGLIFTGVIFTGTGKNWFRGAKSNPSA